MALFLNNIQQYGSVNSLNNESLIHTYNKLMQADYESAKEVLLKKSLLPGEVAFAYYADISSAYGQNAMFAVGPLAKGDNILFKNSGEIETIVDSINETLAYINSSVSNIETTINTSLNNCEDYVDNKIGSLEIKHNSEITSVYHTIKDVSSDLLTVSDKLDNYISTYGNEINDIKNTISDKFIEFTNRIEDVSGKIPTNYYEKIKSIENRLNSINEVPSTINQLNDSIESLNSRMKEIEDKYTLHFQMSIEANARDLSTINKNISTINTDMNEIRKSIGVNNGTIRENLNDIKDKIDDIIGRLLKIDSSINKIENSISTDVDEHKHLL